MSEDAKPAPTIDVAALKREITDSVKSQNEALLASVHTTIQTALQNQPKAAAPKTVSDSGDDDFASEKAALGLDDDQFKALTKIVGRTVNKEVEPVKKTISKEVKDDVDAETTKKELRGALATMYPDLADQNSNLYRQAKVEYGGLDPSMLNSPKALYFAVREAALKLGIAPLDINHAKANAAANPTGDGAGGFSNKPKESDDAFAEFFGVDKKLFAEKVKKTREKRINDPERYRQ